MLFNSFIFFVFLLLVLPVYYALNQQKLRVIFLLICSYVFYGYWDYRFCFLLAFSTVVDFYLGRRMGQEEDDKIRKRLLLTSLISNLSILAIFKYFNFFIDSFIGMAEGLGFQSGGLDFLHINVILPVGISFYTFQTLSYTIDIYRKKLEPTNNFLEFALFVSFFPQLVAGPIERAATLLPQIAKLKFPTRDQLKEGVALIIIGLFKKVIIGDTSGRFVDHIFGQPEYYNSPELLMGLVLFAFQIYADFSGYSSIARGVAKLLGVELMINFTQPYLSANITEFWRRWHISLSSWLRDYLYIPLGGNRHGSFNTYRNLMLTMLLGGLWHGAGWNFIIWGGLHGLYLAIHRIILKGKRITLKHEVNNFSQGFQFISGIVLTNILVLITWLFFRAPDFETAYFFLEKFYYWESEGYQSQILLTCLVYGHIILVLDIFQYRTNNQAFLLEIKNVAIRYGVLASLLFVTMIYMFHTSPAPFVYFQF